VPAAGAFGRPADLIVHATITTAARRRGSASTTTESRPQCPAVR
jgi:hypothetical protein